MGWFAERFMPHMIQELVLVPSEQQLKAAAAISVQVHAAKGRLEGAIGAGAQREVATLKVRPLADKEWRRVIETVAADSGATARLVSGQFGPEVEEAFAAAGAPLFPELPMGAIRCTCKEGNGCRHVLALLLSATVYLDENPYLWLEVLGRPRAGLLAAVQARRKDEAPPDEAPADEDGALSEARFWSTDLDPEAIPVRPGGGGAAPDSLLRRLGPLPLSPEQAAVEILVERGARPVRQVHPVDEVLRAYVGYVGEAASALAHGDLPPRFGNEALPGKAVPIAMRLLPEIEAALREDEAWLSMDELIRRCPTADAMPDPRLAVSALHEALGALPGDLLSAGGRYLCRRQAALSGAAFRHVITWDEQVHGALSRDADWARALAVCGFADVDVVIEKPRVGDELWLHVTDPARPVLSALLRRREGRRPALDAAVPAAAAGLLRHITLSGHLGVAEEEAVAVLLAGGYYRQRTGQDEAWTLPFYAVGLGTDPKGRYLVGRTFTPPTFGRRTGAVWPEQHQVLQGLGGGVAAAVATWWCEAAPGPQDRPTSVPDPALLMEFLWIRVPQAAARRGIAPEDVPAALRRWFFRLGRLPGMAGLYAPHLALCDDAGAYAHRVATLQAAAGDDTAMRAWLLEGYRWIGEARCWPVGARVVQKMLQ
jgi:uncharacterized Zn finger protein